MAYKVKLELMNVQLNKMQNVNNVVNSYILDNKICHEFSILEIYLIFLKNCFYLSAFLLYI